MVGVLGTIKFINIGLASFQGLCVTNKNISFYIMNENVEICDDGNYDDDDNDDDESL